MDGRAGGLQLRQALAVLAVLLASPAWGAVGCTIYVDNDGSNTSPYDTWAKAATTLQTAVSAWGTTDIICVDSAHAESASGTLNLTAVNDSAANLVPIVSVSTADDTYNKASACQVDRTGNADDFNFDGNFSMYGMHFCTGRYFRCPTGSANTFRTYDSDYTMDGSTAAVGIATSENRGISRWIGGTIEFSHANGGQVTSYDSMPILEGVTFAGGVHSNGLFNFTSYLSTNFLRCIGCDFSAYSSETLVDMSSAGTMATSVELYGSLLPATVTIHDSSFGAGHQWIFLSGTDDATGNESFRTELFTYEGDVTTDTSVYHDNGIVFTEGSTKASIKFVPASHVGEDNSLCSWGVSEWIDSTGSKTWATEVVENFTSALTDAEVWQDIFYLGTTSSPDWSLDFGQTVGGTTNLTAGTGLANWTGEPSGSRSAKLSTTLTVNKAGLYKIRWCVGAYEAGKVVHIDPDPTVS